MVARRAALARGAGAGVCESGLPTGLSCLEEMGVHYGRLPEAEREPPTLCVTSFTEMHLGLMRNWIAPRATSWKSTLPVDRCARHSLCSTRGAGEIGCPISTTGLSGVSSKVVCS